MLSSLKLLEGLVRLLFSAYQSFVVLTTDKYYSWLKEYAVVDFSSFDVTSGATTFWVGAQCPGCNAGPDDGCDPESLGGTCARTPRSALVWPQYVLSREQVILALNYDDVMVALNQLPADVLADLQAKLAELPSIAPPARAQHYP